MRIERDMSIEDEAHAYAEAQGYTKGTTRAAARKAYVDAFKLGAREGWMRCGIWHIAYDFEFRPSEIKEVNLRWPLTATEKPDVL